MVDFDLEAARSTIEDQMPADTKFIAIVFGDERAKLIFSQDMDLKEVRRLLREFLSKSSASGTA